MRLRLLAFFPLALLMVLGLWTSAATLVSASDGRGRGSGEGDGVVRLGDVHPHGSLASRVSLESSCDQLRRALHALSHEVVSCDLAPACHGSPLLCPAALDLAPQREYERLRDALHAQCGLSRQLVDFAWGVEQSLDAGEHCGRVHDGFEAAARGEARPSSYLF